jgi:hypothetical protein
MIRFRTRGRPPARDGQGTFVGGLNLSADVAQLAAEQVRRADNARLTEYGGIVKRLGSQRLHAAALGSGNPVRGGFSWNHPSFVRELAVVNGALQTGTYAVGMSWASVTGTLAAGVYPSFAAFRDGTEECVYIADGGPLNKYVAGGTLTTDIAGSATVARLCVYNQRLFGVNGQDQTLYYSDLNNGDTLGDAANGGGEAVVRTFSNQRIIALHPLGASLLIFHVSGISRFTGYTQDDIDIDAGSAGISGDVGTVAPRSIVEVDGALVFLSDRGFYRCTETTLEPISIPVESAFQALDQSDFSRVIAVHNKADRELWFYIPDVGAYCWNYRLNAWTGPWDGGFIDPITHSMWSSRDGSSRPIVLMGGADGFVRRADMPGVYRDDVLSDGEGGDAFTMTVQLHRLYFGDEGIAKALRHAVVSCDLRGSSGAALQWTCGGTTATKALSAGVASGAVWGSGTWGSGTWAGGGASRTIHVDLHGVGPFADLFFIDDGEAEALLSRIRVDGFALDRR